MARNKSLVRCLVPVLALVFSTAPPVFAAERPDSGTISDSTKELRTVVPSKSKVQINVSPEEQEQNAVPEQKKGVKIKVRAIHITGQTIYSEDKLQAVVQDAIGQELTVAELQTVAWRIARYLNSQGYIVANAYVPPQDIKDGIVKITVVPGKYGAVDLRNHSRLKNGVAERFLSNIKPGDYVKKDDLERTLLLISDIGGISINATLARGKTSGTSQLIVEIKDARELTSQFTWDNYGNSYTGEDRGNINLNFNNISGQGDMVRISGNNSGGGMNNFNFDYLLPVGKTGARVGASYSQLHYSLGGDFVDLDAWGLTKTTGIYVVYPLVRARDHNLWAQIRYDHRKIGDRIDQYSSFTDKKANAWNVALSGDSRDKFYGGGVNNFALTITTGRLSFNGGIDEYGISVKDDDSQGLKTAGSYTKENLSFSRWQYLNDRLNFYFSLAGQLASKNLDSTEKLYLGGASGVRAYPQGEASGDEGYILTGELRWDIPTPKFQLAAFIDNGRVTINKNPLPDAGSNHRTLSGVGVGLILNRLKDYTLRVDYAHKIGNSAATSDEDKSRLWLKLTEYF